MGMKGGHAAKSCPVKAFLIYFMAPQKKIDLRIFFTSCASETFSFPGINKSYSIGCYIYL
jgi:hypothetical protein